MRDIKFRFWVKKAKEMCGWELMKKECDRLSALETGDFIPMQFTGLKDKNGKEIFEGDVVRFTWWWFDGQERESDLTGTIVYSDDLMSFQMKGVKNKEWETFTGYENDQNYLTPFSELRFSEDDFEVVGNIYENPELIKES